MLDPQTELVRDRAAHLWAVLVEPREDPARKMIELSLLACRIECIAIERNFVCSKRILFEDMFELGNGALGIWEGCKTSGHGRRRVSMTYPCYRRES